MFKTAQDFSWYCRQSFCAEKKTIIPLNPHNLAFNSLYCLKYRLGAVKEFGIFLLLLKSGIKNANFGISDVKKCLQHSD